MSVKKQCVAMLLAGGQGSRLQVLTANQAKPALPFGGKYRIIDFALSNCINSNIDTVGVLTQYRPHVLNAYIGTGQPWDLDRLEGGVQMLPPYVKEEGGQWYKGTANAIYQNMDYISNYNPDYVLVLSGDHIYKMDYARMIEHHRQNGADGTIAVIEVPWDEAPRFGIMNADADGTVTEFEEKPKKPKSNLASMGIYVFTWQKLRDYLMADEQNPESSNDFGSDIIPAMLKAEEKLIVYPFDGYWKDVGTIDSFWEANMDMLLTSPDFSLFDPQWPVFGRESTAPPHYSGDESEISHSMVTEGCEIYGMVENSVVFDDVRVDRGASVLYSIIMPRAVIEEGAVVEYAIVAEDAVISRSAHVGGQPTSVPAEEWGVAVVGPGTRLEEGQVVAPKAVIGVESNKK